MENSIGLKRIIISELMVRLAPLNVFMPSSDCLTDRTKGVRLLWILFVIYVSRLPLLYCPVCFYFSCDHLLGK